MINFFKYTLLVLIVVADKPYSDDDKHDDEKLHCGVGYFRVCHIADYTLTTFIRSAMTGIAESGLATEAEVVSKLVHLKSP